MNAPLRVLHLEDDVKDAELVHAGLEAEGIANELTRVETEQDFVSLLNRGSCDLILADYTLPSFDGLSALRIAQRQSPDVPFIFVSGTLGEDVAIEALKTGATDFVLKTRLNKLVPAVTRALREAREKTERRRTEEQLIHEQQRFRDIVNSVEGVVWEADAETFVFTFVSEKAERILGYPIERWLQEPTFWKDHLYPEDREWAVEFCTKATAEKRDHDFEYRMIAADGRIVWLRDLVTIAVKDGRPKLLRGVMVDITERKHVEDTLRLSEACMSRAQQLAGVGSYSYRSTHKDGNWDTCEYWSVELWRIADLDPSLGFPSTETIFSRIHPEDRQRMVEANEQVIKNGRALDIKYRYFRADGQLRLLHTIATPIYENGAAARLVGATMDITEQEQMTKQLRRREAFLAEAQRLSHTGSFGWKPATNEHFWSEETFRIWEYDASTKITLQLVLDRIHPEDIPRAQRVITSAAENGQDFDLEYRLLMPSGSLKHIHVVAHAVGADLGNIEFIGAVMDITERKKAQEALNAAKARFEGILEIAEDAIISMDSDQRIILFNQGAEKVFGYAQSEIIGKPLDILLPQRFAHSHRGHIEGFAKSPDVSRKMGQRREVFGRRKDGSEFPAEASISKLTLGNEVVFTVILRDITDRKRAEEALQKSEQQWKDVFENNPTMYFMVKADGTILSVNPFGAEQLGYAVDELVGSPVMNIFYEQDRIVVQEKIAGCLKQLGRSMSWEFRKVHKDGSVLWVRETARAVMRDDQPIVLVACEDITERKRVEDALRLSEGYMVQAQQVARLGSWAYRPPGVGENFGVREHLSDEFIRIFGFDPAKKHPTDQELFAVVHPEDLKRVEEEITQLFAKGRDLDVIYRIIRPDGQLRIIRDRGVAVVENGVFVRVVGVCLDITEQEQMTRELQRSEYLLAEGERISHTGSWVYKPATGELTSSKERFRIFGLDPEKTPSSTQVFSERVLPDDKPRLRKILDSAIREKRDFEFEYRIVTPDGAIKHVHTIAHAITNEYGALVEFFGSTADITERKRADEALRRSEAYLTEAQRLSHTGSFASDGESRKIRYWSEENFRIWDFDPQQGPPTREMILQRIHPEDRHKILERVEQARHEKTDYAFEFRILLPDGTVKHIYAIGHLVFSASGELVEVLGTHVDVTERKRAEEALRRSEAYLAEAQRISHTGSWSRSPATGEFLYCSEEMLRIFDWNPQQGMPTVEILMQRVHPEDIKFVRQIIQEALRQKVDYTVDFRILLPDGTMKFIQNIGHPVFNADGEVVEYIGTSVDVTERKRAEDALRRSEAFLAEGQRISQTGSWAWKPATGEWTSSKERFRIFGLDPETTNPSFDVFWERVHPEDKPRFKRVFDAAIREKSDFKIGYRIVTPDWVIKHVHTVGHAITDESGELIEFIGSTMDVTERKRAEERAQSQNNDVKLALNAFVEELDLNRFLGHVITGLTKQFQATSSELWLSEDSSSTATLFMTCEQGKVVRSDEREPTGLPPRATHITREQPDIGRIPRIIELPAHESLLRPAHLESLKHQDIKTLLLVPLVLGEQNLGFVELRFAVATRLTSDDVNLAQALVHHATLALQLSRLAHRTEQMAVTEERNRMAREIHDTLAQAFAGVVLHSEALGTALGVNKSRSEKALFNIQKLARAGLEEARRSVQALRPRALEGSTLSQALEQMAKRYSEEAKFACDFKQQGAALKLSAEIQNELFRIAQEAMTNVSKHAQAKSVWITLEFKDNQAILTVRDDGIGFAATGSPKPKGGYGLFTMRERAQRIGGQIEIKSPTGGGTAICVLVPLTEKEKPSNQTI